jgi:hypothetical protein
LEPRSAWAQYWSLPLPSFSVVSSHRRGGSGRIAFYIQRGPFDRRIQWEAILQWQLVPVPGTPGAHFLTIWHGYDDDRARASTIMTPRDTAPDEVARVLQGFQRAV